MLLLLCKAGVQLLKHHSNCASDLCPQHVALIQVTEYAELCVCVCNAQVVMEYNFHWAGKQQMEMLMQPLPPTWGKFGHTMATWASSLFRCKVRHSPTFVCICMSLDIVCIPYLS